MGCVQVLVNPMVIHGGHEFPWSQIVGGHRQWVVSW